MIKIKRVYEPPETDDGSRFLVERLWPRGIKKVDLELHGWLRDVAPSSALRVWFSHDPDKWEQFRLRYYAELDEHPEALRRLLDTARTGNVTLLYSARDTEHNNALALRDYLEKRLNVGEKVGRQ